MTWVAHRGYRRLQPSQRLLRAAAEGFARRGYGGTRVSEIGAAAGLSNGAPLQRFPEFSLAGESAAAWSSGQIRGPRTLPLRIG